MPNAPAALPDGKIQDFIDGKIRNDTPEEYVRQNIEKRLVRELGYPAEHVAVEVPIKIGSGRAKRADLVVFEEGEEHTQANALRDSAWALKRAAIAEIEARVEAASAGLTSAAA